MARALDTAVKVGVVGSALLAAAAVAYHFAVYIPARDARLEAERRLERRLIEDRARSEALQRENAERETAQRAALLKEQANDRYRSCLQRAEWNYSSNWDFSCQRRSTRQAKEFAECLAGKFSADVCQRTQGEKIPPKDCTHPKDIADGHNNDLSKERDRCLREYQAGVQ